MNCVRGWGKNMPEIKRLRCNAPEFRVTRDENSEGLPAITGYAAVFNEITDLGMFRESISPGAFEETLKAKDDVRALFNHDPNLVLGRSTSGTLELKEDKKGLYSRIIPPDTALGRDLVQLIERGDISQMSFGFWIEAEEVVREEGEKTHFIIKRAKLFDVSPVTFPAYPQTEVDIERSFRSRLSTLSIDNAPALAKRKRELEILQASLSWKL